MKTCNYLSVVLPLFLLQLTSAFAQQPSDRNSITFNRTIPSPRDTRIVKHTNQISGARTSGDKDAQLKHVENRHGVGIKRKVEILEIREGNVQQIRVRYLKHHFWYQELEIIPEGKGSDQPPEKRKGAVHGRTYQLSRRDNGIKIQKQNNSKLSKREREIIKSDFSAGGNLGFESHVLSKFLDGKTVTTGQTFKASKDLRQKWQKKFRTNLRFSALEFELIDIRNRGETPKGVFRLKASLQKRGKFQSSNAYWEGKLVISADTRLHSRTLFGPIVTSAYVTVENPEGKKQKKFQIETGRLQNKRTVRWK